MKALFKTAIVVGMISINISMPAFASDTSDEIIELQKEVRALKESQDSIKIDLAEIRKILESSAHAAAKFSPPPKPLKPPKSKIFEPREVMITGASVMGNANARVTLIEYNDYLCLHCARFFRQTMPKIIEHYIKNGKLKFVAREFPIPNLQPRAAAASQAALCAGGQGKYWEMHDILFYNQRNLWDDNLRAYASQVGLDTSKFNDCLAREDYAGQIAKDIEEGQAMGVRGTPSFVLGLTDPTDHNRIKVTKFVYGARPYEVFAQAIEELLAGDGEARAAASP